MYSEWRDVTRGCGLCAFDSFLLFPCCSLYQLLEANVTTVEVVLLTFSADFCNQKHFAYVTTVLEMGALLSAHMRKRWFEWMK